MNKTVAQRLCTLAAIGNVLTGCSKSDDVVGTCGNRSFSMNFVKSMISMRSIREYDGMSNTIRIFVC